MKILNKKGFVLVETLIVTVFIVTLFIFVYQNLVPHIGEYEKMETYDDIDSVYASNIYKQTLLRYGNLDYIDSYLATHTYIDITDCNDTNIYRNAAYCMKLKKALSILDDDYIFLTNYDISSFREEVNENEFFDSGKLSNFKSYIHTISNVDSFYSQNKNPNLTGKYRLFLTRTVINRDTTTLKYTNIGIFTGSHQQYYAGDSIIFDPGDGPKGFYVLKNSPATEDKVTLILEQNLSGTTAFNSTGDNQTPDLALSFLKNNTSQWTNTELLTASDQYTSESGYTISYNGYHARLLDENDIYTILGCSNSHTCFNVNNLFDSPFDVNTLGWLSKNLSANQGYWLASSVVQSTDTAWTVQPGKVTPVLSNTTTMGVRPVIVVSKDKLL